MGDLTSRLDTGQAPPKEPVSGLELKVFNRYDEEQVRIASEITYKNWKATYDNELWWAPERLKLYIISRHLRARSKMFRDGQIMIYYQGKPVGIINTNRRRINRWEDIRDSWKAETGRYKFRNYDPNGNVLVCPNVSMLPQYRDLKIGSHLIVAVYNLAQKINSENAERRARGEKVQDIEAIIPYSKFEGFSRTKDAVEAGKAMVINIKGKYYVLEEEHVRDDALKWELSQRRATVVPIEEFRPRNYVFFRKFDGLDKVDREDVVDKPYDIVPRFHGVARGEKTFVAVPIGIKRKVVDGLIPGFGLGGRPGDKDSGGHNPIFMYDLTPDQRMFNQLVSPDYNGLFRDASKGIGRGMSYYQKTA